jgi:hypothetical protein
MVPVTMSPGALLWTMIPGIQPPVTVLSTTRLSLAVVDGASAATTIPPTKRALFFPQAVVTDSMNFYLEVTHFTIDLLLHEVYVINIKVYQTITLHTHKMAVILLVVRVGGSSAAGIAMNFPYGLHFVQKPVNRGYAHLFVFLFDPSKQIVSSKECVNFFDFRR